VVLDKRLGITGVQTEDSIGDWNRWLGAQNLGPPGVTCNTACTLIISINIFGIAMTSVCEGPGSILGSLLVGFSVDRVVREQFSLWVFQVSPQQYHSYLLTYLFTYLLTYLLTPWSRELLEKLTGFQLVKKFPAFYGARRFITVFTNTRHLSLSWGRSV